MNTYGILDSNNCHIDVSATEKGAKNYATRHGYKTVSIRYNCGYDVDIVSVRSKAGKWMHPDWVPTREIVYKVILSNEVCIYESTDELIAERQLFLSMGKYGIDSLTIKKGWKSIDE